MDEPGQRSSHERKIPNLGGNVLENFDADVLSFSDYYPFGMLVPNRHGSSNSYRYGFNGMEKDDELKGIGNSYDFGARMLDPRVGRWFTYDQMETKFPSNSTYNAFNNNPIFYIDPDGNEIKEWKYFRKFMGFTFGPFYNNLTSIYNSDSKFDKSYTKLQSSSKVFKKVVNRLKNSSRSYQFQTVLTKSGDYKNKDKGGFFDRSPKGTSNDPFTINLVVDLKNEKTYSGNKSIIFEEVFHAAQNDYALDKGNSLTSVQKEVEAKLVKNIEGVAKNEKGFSYEYMEFEGRDEIFGALKKGKKLTSDQRNKLQNAIYDLEASIRSVPEYEKKMKNEYFYAGTDLKFAEELYGQKLTNENEGVTVTGDGK